MYEILDFKKYDHKLVKLNIEQLWHTACPDPDIYENQIGLVIGQKAKPFTFSYNTEPDWLLVEMDNGNILWLNEDEIIVLPE